MERTELCKIDCYGLLENLLKEGLEGDNLLRTFTWKYIEQNQGKPTCYCDKILNDLIRENVPKEDLLEEFKKKQLLVVKGFDIIVDEALELARKLTEGSPGENKKNFD